MCNKDNSSIPTLDFSLRLWYNIFISKFKKGEEMNLQESGEMYLESIYVLLKNTPNVRSIDVVEYMNFSKPSVSRAIGLLKSGGYVTVNKDGYLSLTDVGYEVAEKIYERHKILTVFLEKIGVSSETATQDACKIEHVIIDESFEAIKQIVNKS